MRRFIRSCGLFLMGAALAQGAGPHTQSGANIEPVPLTPEPAPARLRVNDEMDGLEQELAPPARFADCRPQFQVERRTFVFQHAGGPQTQRWQVVRDGARDVALVRTSDIHLLAAPPDSGPLKLPLPTGRYHLDTQIGPALAIHPFVIKVRTHGTIYTEETQSAAPVDTWLDHGTALTLRRTQRAADRSVDHRFVFTVDPVFGYRLDALYRVTFSNAPAAGAIKWPATTFCPGNYTPWPETALYDRTVFTPGGGGLVGWANNLVTMDRCDTVIQPFAWRDGGFIAYLDPRTGWSPCRTRFDGGGAVTMRLCNAHNDFHVSIPLPDLTPAPDGAVSYQATHRLMMTPPEITTALWERVSLIETSRTTIVIAIGRLEDFERQPVPLSEPARGLIWTANAPPLSRQEARSGTNSLLISGRQWPNLPQVGLLPDSRYRLEGWFKVAPWSDSRRETEQKKEADTIARLKAAGKAAPPATDWDQVKPAAYIRGDLYEWSPHTGSMLVTQQTTTARAGTNAWQRVSLDFTTQAWDPFINLSFHADYCDAYLDDFALIRVDP